MAVGLGVGVGVDVGVAVAPGVSVCVGLIVSVGSAVLVGETCTCRVDVAVSGIAVLVGGMSGGVAQAVVVSRSRHKPARARLHCIRHASPVVYTLC